MADLWNRLQEMHSGGLDTRILLIIMTMNYSVEGDQVSFAAFIQICIIITGLLKTRTLQHCY